VRVAVGHGDRVVPREILDVLRRHPGLEHLGDARVLEGVEVECGGQGQAFQHPVPGLEQVPGGVGLRARLEMPGEYESMGRERFRPEFPEVPEHIVGQGDDALLVVLRHIWRYPEHPFVEVYVPQLEHEYLLWADQVLEAELHNGYVFRHAPFQEIVEYPLAFVFGDGRPVLFFFPLALERLEGVGGHEAVADKGPEHAFQELEHVVVGVRASSSGSVFRQQFGCLFAREVGAKPVGQAFLFAPCEEEGELRLVAPRRVLPEGVLFFTVEVFGGLLHGLRSSARLLFPRQGVPASIEPSVGLRAQQARIAQTLAAVPDAVAADSSPLEFSADRVKNMVAHIDLLVGGHLCRDEVDERCWHDCELKRL